MICPNCGREIADGTVCPCQTMTLSSNPAVNVIKTVGSSKLFLSLAILKTLSVALLIVILVPLAVGRVPSYLYAQLFNIVEVNPRFLERAVDSAGVFATISIVILLIFSVFTVVPYWLHYVTCKSRKSGNISTSGLTLWKVFTWASMARPIFLCIFLAVSLILLFVYSGVIMVTDSFPVPGESFALMAILYGIMFIVFGAFLSLVFAYYIAQLRVINRAKAIANTGRADDRVSQFLIVLNWISGCYSAFSALPILAIFPMISLAAFVSAAAKILSALCMTAYKKKMTEVMYPPVMPIYAQPAAPAVPPVSQQPAGPVTEQPAETTEGDSGQSE